MARRPGDAPPAGASSSPDGSDDDIVGSPYAISAYEPADNLGGASGPRDAPPAAGGGRHRTHPRLRPEPRSRSTTRGCGDIPDWFVHADAAQRAEDPDAYFEVRSDGRHWIAHGRDPNFPSWTDTAQLDYRHPDVPRAMTQALREVATRCDGVVCSMAMLVLDDVFRSTWSGRSIPPAVAEDASPFGEFWWHAASAVHDVYPQFLLIGEAYWGHEYRLQQLGFDYTLDKTLLDRLLSGDARSVAGHLRADDAYQRRSVRLLEDRNGSRIAARMSPEHERAAALVEATLPGMLLVRDGQVEGAREEAPVQFRREPAETPDHALHDFYCRLLQATDDETFRRGQAIRLEPILAWDGNETHEGIVARLWVGQHRQLRLAIANLTDETAQAYIPLALPEFAGKIDPPRRHARRDHLRPSG